MAQHVPDRVGVGKAWVNGALAFGHSLSPSKRSVQVGFKLEGAGRPQSRGGWHLCRWLKGHMLNTKDWLGGQHSAKKTQRMRVRKPWARKRRGRKPGRAEREDLSAKRGGIRAHEMETEQMWACE